MVLPVDPARYGAFLSVMAVMAATPGPANLFAIANGAEKGKAAAVIGAVGMNSASLVWFAAAALGLGALVAAFPQVFHLLTWLGAAYVAWLGVKSLLKAWKDRGEPQEQAHIKTGRSAFRDGFMVQIANPKVLLFFTAVLPPFVDVNRPVAPQMAMFAAAAVSMDMISMTSYGLGGAALAARMTEPRFRRIFAVFVGVLLIAAAILIFLRG
ncbi:LysE family translocator [Caulobacter sp. NIBR2454]|uniref:LysE family translocator n=1 Tax=Caulobacter sp. NIBR2454 TaxID=3015996 RepID=UPI0022B6F511|nr:LysE family translocator [Caulobacter sp. NIBR2454]